MQEPADQTADGAATRKAKYAILGVRADGLALQEMLRRVCLRMTQEPCGAKTQRITRFLALYADQKPVIHIAKEIGVHRDTINRSIRPQGMEMLAEEIKYDVVRHAPARRA